MDNPDLADGVLLFDETMEGFSARADEARAACDPVLDGFDEHTYLLAFPRLALAIKEGKFASALDHYRKHGAAENRLNDVAYRRAKAGNPVDTAEFPAAGIDAFFMSTSGLVLFIGWVNDESSSLLKATVMAGQDALGSTHHIARCRREDAEGIVATTAGKLLGFWGIRSLPKHSGPDAVAVTGIALTAGQERRTFPVNVTRVNDARLLELSLEYLAASRFFANPQVESHLQLEGGLGKILIDMNVQLSRQVIGAAYAMQFGPRRAKFAGSIIVCLYGKAEFLFIQAAFFSPGAGYGNYEFIYVSNSPELTDQLVKEATLAARIYCTSITLVILPGNAGFGAANNVAVNFAQSDRILIVNPDVFPRDARWAERHEAILESRAADEVAMFGVPLYYDDGSLMHGGMFIDTDIGLSVGPNGIERREMLRVEHYGKGAPPQTSAWLASRPVTAVTGAFISADRAWFERLGGFSLEYVLGHYEDADLCLKSFSAGKPVWMHDVPFWHLEGKGSTRRIAHEGGSIVNNWHFTRTWGTLVAGGMGGRAPRLLASTR